MQAAEPSSPSGPDSPYAAGGRYMMSPEEEAAEAAKIRAVGERGKRKSVSATTVTADQIKEYKKPVYAKDEATVASLAEMLQQNEKMQVLCGHLDKNQLLDVVNAFYSREYLAGAEIIRQSDEGTCLYIIAAGNVDIYVARRQPDGTDISSKVATFFPGQLFGELALMYNAPRAATVVASENPVSTWVLDANDFKMLLAQSSQAQYAKYEGWLREVSIFQTLNHFELAQLADIIESELYDVDEVIVQQGDVGDKFYILEEGTCTAYITGDAGEQRVKDYHKQGEYFGEIALLTAAPRKATVRATGQGCSVASLSQENFTALLGPIATILKDHVDKYPQYAEFLK
jgi:cAMP-dependent protein kinase regulator